MPPSLSVHGETRQNAFSELEEIVAFVILDLKQEGEQISGTHGELNAQFD